MHGVGVRGSVQQGRGVVNGFGVARLHRDRRGGVGASRGGRSGPRAVGRGIGIGRRGVV